MRISARAASYVLALTIFVTDFVTKRVVLAEVDTFMRGIPLIDGILRFTYVRNAGAAFGMLQGARWPFVIVSSAAVVGLSILLWRRQTEGLRRFSYAMILAGAAGNLVDRIFYGGLVVDFIEMRWQEHVFPVYNVADMGVSIGAALLVLSMLREKEEPVSTRVSPESGLTQAQATDTEAVLPDREPALDAPEEEGHARLSERTRADGRD